MTHLQFITCDKLIKEAHFSAWTQRGICAILLGMQRKLGEKYSHTLWNLKKNVFIENRKIQVLIAN